MADERKSIPLVLDLDGTLIANDSLIESLILLTKRKPVYLIIAVFWILKGKLFFKNKMLEHCRPDPSFYTYRQDVIEYLKQEKLKGRPIVLASATMQELANQVANYLGLFDAVYGSSPELNLRSGAKRDLLVKLYAEKSFDYAGDSKSDIKVWAAANKSIVVYPNCYVKRQARKISNIDKLYDLKLTGLIRYLYLLFRSVLGTIPLLPLVLLGLTSLSSNKQIETTGIILLVASILSLAVLSLFVNKQHNCENDRVTIYTYSGNYFLKISIVVFIINSVMSLYVLDSTHIMLYYIEMFCAVFITILYDNKIVRRLLSIILAILSFYFVLF